MKRSVLLAIVGILTCVGVASAQAPGVIYTWDGTGDIRQWGNGNLAGTTGGTNFTVLTNSIPGELTATEMGDALDPQIVGGPVVISDYYPRRLESSPDTGGLDVTGLTYLEMDIHHNSPTATVNVQFFAQVTPSYTYVSGGSDGNLGRSPSFSPDWALGPGDHTIRFPVNQLTAAEQAYFTGIGVSIRDHAAVGNLTWTIKELRSVGTPLITRDIATHDVGSSDSGLNGAYINFDEAAVQGSDVGNNRQIGLTQNTSGTGSLEWTDLGGGPGASIGWGNGTSFGTGNYNERPASLDNYNQVIYRLKATDPLNLGGTLSIQSYFQNNNYADYQVPGTQDLPVDGQYHDLVFSLAGIHQLRNVDAFGINLGAHANNAVIDVDLVRFTTVAGVQGDYNNNGVVDAADYVLWRNGGPLANEVNTPGVVDPSDYTAWRARFGNTSGAGSLAGSAAVPEPTCVALLLSVLVAGIVIRNR